MNPEAFYLAQLPTIERVATFVARRNHLSKDEIEDFVASVRLRLFEDDYAIIRKFEGRSSFSTYLTTVIQRMCVQYRVQMWGKWRPSPEARRLGDKAVALERLITRDRYTFQEAVQLLTTRAQSPYTRQELEAIYVQLPSRRGAAVTSEVISTGDVEGDPADLDDPLEERGGQAERIGRALTDVISHLPAEDQLIIRLRFFQGLKVPEIARRLQIDQKKLYKRIDKMFSILRRELENRQIDSAQIAALLTRGDIEPLDTPPNVRTIKSADLPGIYVDEATAQRTLEGLVDEPKKAPERK